MMFVSGKLLDVVGLLSHPFSAHAWKWKSGAF